jgi:hypothetical protein
MRGVLGLSKIEIRLAFGVNGEDVVGPQGGGCVQVRTLISSVDAPYPREDIQDHEGYGIRSIR